MGCNVYKLADSDSYMCAVSNMDPNECPFSKYFGFSVYFCINPSGNSFDRVDRLNQNGDKRTH